MHKPIRWSSFAEKDFSDILHFLNSRWSNLVASNFILEIESCISLVQKTPEQFPLFSKKHQIRKCVVTRHNTLYFRITTTNIEILRLYDTRQDPKSLQFK